MATLLRTGRLRRCPERGVLADFDLGKLAADDSSAIAEHLSSCERCEGILQDLQKPNSGDPLLVLLRKSLEGPALPTEFFHATIEYVSEPPAPGGATAAVTPPTAAGGFPRAIGPYLAFEEIGRGGMGVVYRAQQVTLKRDVALKMILAGRYASASTIARFLREGETVARLRHPNMVQVYELGQTEGLPYYSMELIGTGSLQRRLAGGPLDPREAASLVQTLALAMEYAHGEGILHRDLKPGNILLSEDGTPRITDFGLAKFLDTQGDGSADGGGDGPATATLTATDVIVGTPNFMAPEQTGGRPAEIGRPTDVYALGAILYATLTGRPPFSGETRIETLRLVRDAEPALPSRIRPGLSTSLEAICLKCLEKAPARRYGSARALADDLGRWLNDERPQASPNWRERIRRGVRRNRPAIRIGGAVGMAVLALSVFGAALSHKDPDRPIREIEAKLARGLPVTLIGDAGEPAWRRWLTGTSNSQWDLAPDGSFRIHSGPMSLVELLPDPQTDRFRFSALVRHETSEIGGKVGIFFSRVTSPDGPGTIPTLFSINMTFNDRIDFDFLSATIPKAKGPPRLTGNPVTLSSLLHATPKGRRPVIGQVLFGSGNTHFPLFREGAVKPLPWHHLEVIVTPETLTASWDGKPLSAPTSVPTLEAKLRRTVTEAHRGQAVKLHWDLLPTFKTRGGLGLFISGSSASFRDVKISPQ